jgi:hypothetical protein
MEQCFASAKSNHKPGAAPAPRLSNSVTILGVQFGEGLLE